MYKSMELSVEEEQQATTPTTIIIVPVTISRDVRAKLRCVLISNTFPIDVRIQMPTMSKLSPTICKVLSS